METGHFPLVPNRYDYTCIKIYVANSCQDREAAACILVGGFTLQGAALDMTFAFIYEWSVDVSVNMDLIHF